MLGLSHLVNIAFATALSRSDEAVPLLKKISSTTFNQQLSVAAQVVSENPQLYFEIQEGTVGNAQAVEAFTGALDELVTSVTGNDEQAFIDIMRRAHARLSEAENRTR